ncbi:MAG: ester cyclase, partial [Candidatus Bathyarchaeota archaeon]
PDFHLTIEEIIAEGDKVWVHYTETMTHTGEYRGIAPTGKKITYPSIWIFRIVDGKMVGREGFGNDLDYYKQLGVIEYTEKGKKLFPEEAK